MQELTVGPDKWLTHVQVIETGPYWVLFNSLASVTSSPQLFCRILLCLRFVQLICQFSAFPSLPQTPLLIQGFQKTEWLFFFFFFPFLIHLRKGRMRCPLHCKADGCLLLCVRPVLQCSTILLWIVKKTRQISFPICGVKTCNLIKSIFLYVSPQGWNKKPVFIFRF